MDSRSHESDTATTPLSRRRLLGVAGAATLAGTAGCLGGLLSSSSRRAIEREEPTEPRAGTPGEFYALLERNEIAVDALYQDGTSLELTYRSAADDESASTEEIAIVATVFNENLVKNDAGIETLYAEIANPFDGQAHGWGAETEWFEAYNDGEMNRLTLWNNIFNSRVFEDDLEE